MNLRDVAGYLKSAEQISIIMGAGASRSAGIPTAPLLVKRINDDFSHCLGRLSPTERTDYGRTMGALAPGDRKSLIQPLLDDSQINWGHVALACITNHVNIKRILTFNFDLILERAASLVGIHLPVYDFGVAPTRELSGLAAPAIFHLHGQSYGLRLMNSDAETAAHKEVLRPLLADSLRNHLTIVIGYSGEADAAFKVMEEEFNSHKNLIWLGYEPEPKPHLTDLLAKDYAMYRGDCDFDRTMIELAEFLGCWPPEVIKNPPRHILVELSDVAKYPVALDAEVDILTSTRRRLEDAATDWEGSKDGEAKAQEALMSGAPLEPSDSPESLSKNERLARSWTETKNGLDALMQAKSLKNSAERIVKLREAIAQFEQSLKFETDKHEPYLGLSTALSLLSKEVEEDERRKLQQQALVSITKADNLKPHSDLVLRNFGLILLDMARKSDGTLLKDKLDKAGKKINEMFELDSSKDQNNRVYASYLVTRSNIESGDTKAKTLELAEETIKKSLALKREQHSYIRARILALRGLEEEAVSELYGCLTADNLPSRRRMLEELEFMSLRDKPEFMKLLERMPE